MSLLIKSDKKSGETSDKKSEKKSDKKSGKKIINIYIPEDSLSIIAQLVQHFSDASVIH